MNKSMFKEEYAYTFNDVLDMTGEVVSRFGSNITIVLLLLGCDMISADATGRNIYGNPLGLSFVSLETYPGTYDSVFPSYLMQFLNKLISRYKDSYAFVSEYDETEAKSRGLHWKFLTKLFNILDYTFDKYDRMLSIYAANRDHLLDKLQKTYSEDSKRTIDIDTENSSHSKSAGSDTPQTINVSGDIEAINGYFDRFDQAADAGTSNSDSTDEYDKDTTESYDPTTLMARIKEIETDYSNIMFKWIEEFDKLFIEEVNY